MNRTEFVCRVIKHDPTGYYYDDWSKSVSLTVVARNRDEALHRAIELMGKPLRGRTWRARVVSSADVAAPACDCKRVGDL